jgi:hypothetical protein
VTVAVVGGLDRLSPHYVALADEHDDLEIKVFNRLKRGVSDRIATANGIVLVTNLVSHSTAHEVYRLARQKGVPVVLCHRASVSAMRECLTRMPCLGCNGMQQDSCPLLEEAAGVRGRVQPLSIHGTRKVHGEPLIG